MDGGRRGRKVSAHNYAKNESVACFVFRYLRQLQKAKWHQSAAALGINLGPDTAYTTGELMLAGNTRLRAEAVDTTLLMVHCAWRSTWFKRPLGRGT